MEHGVERKCIVTGKVVDKDNLLRFVALEGCLVPDFRKKFAGKGIYVTNSRAMLQAASEKKLFSKAVRKNLAGEDKICEIVENMMHNRGLEFLNLARKAGALVFGFEKVREQLVRGNVEFVLEASDAGADGKNKIASLCKNVPVFSFYTIEELDKATNRVNTVHAAFLKGKMAKSALSEYQKAEKFFRDENLKG